MDDETLTDLLNVHADTNDQMRKLHARLEILELTTEESECVRLMLQVAFWSGAEAMLLDDDFKRAVKEIYEERNK